MNKLSLEAFLPNGVLGFVFIRGRAEGEGAGGGGRGEDRLKGEKGKHGE